MSLTGSQRAAKAKPARSGEIRLPPAIDRLLKRLAFTTRRRQKMYRRLSALLMNGVPLATSVARLRVVAESLGRKGGVERQVLENWQIRMRGDPSFGNAVRGWAPEEERLLIVAGETGGQLAQTLINLCGIMDHVASLRAALRAAITYPFVLIGAMFGYLSVVSLVAVPRFAEVYDPENWVGFARLMFHISEIALFLLVGFILFIPASYLIYQVSVRTIGGRARVVLDRFAPFSFYRLQSGAGFLLGLGSLLQAGVQATESMYLLMRRSTTRYMRDRVGAALSGLRSGLSVGRALQHTRYEFPDREILADLVTYSDLANFDQRLLDISSTWVQQTVEDVTKRTAAVNRILLVMLIIVVGLMVFGLFQIQQQVASGIRGGGIEGLARGRGPAPGGEAPRIRRPPAPDSPPGEGGPSAAPARRPPASRLRRPSPAPDSRPV